VKKPGFVQKEMAEVLGGGWDTLSSGAQLLARGLRLSSSLAACRYSVINAVRAKVEFVNEPKKP